ncbi:hypothetical protein HPP92_025097 [Vanilla planifolia]|uniref:Bifunctional inhibitor/plant lipid transfer protein/seed storage helical domain-containing protein n=1 Tax=Vanilla planifolia TaxID=51239 RepID=A0A835PFA0_VANPL|nr:hypothetical protein HPP92_025369 [Vanilla planifolia]KAG0453793.1 hypothetical protein HPP92_025097 [Vanilla planifolia]
MAVAVLATPIIAQDCSAGLSDVTVCTPFVVTGPGGKAPNPSPECCNALKGVNHDCLCSTLSIISKLPSSCNLPPLSCGA